MASKLRLQFHADPAELFELAGVWAEQEGYLRTAEQFFPVYRAVVAGIGVASAEDLGINRVDRIALTPASPVLPVSDEEDFANRNRDALFIKVGARSDEGLRQSAMGGMTDDRDLAKRWKNLAAKARKQMHKGAVVRNPHTAASEHGREHLHTVGAHALAREGVKMLAIAGWNEFEFDDLT
jgi:hypothetical protein